MSPGAQVKFAVVREDPEVELAVARHVGARRALLVASGGCTALAFAESRPDLEVELYDLNPAQLAHVRARAQAVGAGELARLNVEDPSPEGLSQAGAFERLFRTLRGAWVALVCEDRPQDLERFFTGDAPARAALRQAWQAHPQWPVLFELAFHERLLVAMFGPDAVQHAPPGSYPAYFQRVFERGLGQERAHRNPFLQHVLLQRYLGADAPSFLRLARQPTWRMHLGALPALGSLERFGLVHLSNIFDWSTEAQVAEQARALRTLRPGAAITVRQLNNQRPVETLLGPDFRFEPALAEALLARDRSLFYERLLVGVRRDAPR